MGTLLGAGCAFAYSLTILFGRSLANDGFETATVLSLRFGVAALATFVLLKAMRRPLLPVAGERMRVFLLGAIGYAVESSFFFAGLKRGSAAAVVLLFYSYPAVVTVIGRLWSKRTPLTLGLSIGGAILVVATGGDVHISRAGVIFALAAATTFAFYLLASERLVERTDSLTTAAWVAAGASLSLLGRGLVTGTLQSPAGHLPQLLGNGLASGTAFALMFMALRRIGPRRTAIVMT
ncbi:MAG: EamA family transporter, partial [Actinobacteria bacterium]|nr:EamA family transporter [Actinomycetota bacterium]